MQVRYFDFFLQLQYLEFFTLLPVMLFEFKHILNKDFSVGLYGTE